MDRNTIIGILLIGVIFIGYSYYNNNKLDKAYDKEISYADSLFIAEDYTQAILAYRKAQSFKPREQYPQTQISEINQTMGLYDNSLDENAQPSNNIQKQIDPVNSSADALLEDTQVYKSDKERESQYGIFHKASVGEEKFLTLENDLLKLVFTNKGGKLYSAELKNFQTHDTLPLMLFEGDSTVFGFQFFTFDNHPIETNNLYFTPQTDLQTMLVEDQPLSFTMRLEAGEGKYIDYIYSLKPDEYMLDFDLKIVGLQESLARNLNSLDLGWELYMPQQEKGRVNENNYAGIKFKYYQDEVDGSRIRASKDVEEFDISTKLEWLAYKDQFFSTVLISEDPFLNGWVQSTKTEESERYLRFLQAKLSVPYKGDSNEAYKMHFYLGPNHFKTLKKYEMDLEELVFLGKNIIRIINEYVIIQLFHWLNRFIGNYGLIILVLTVIIKMALFPLTYKSFISQAKMRVLKPQVDEINEKFPKKEDAMKKQQATMALYKKVGVSPVGGCLPMMLQMPILFAMFRFFPTSIELRQESFLWAHDLSTYDSILNLPWDIPMYGDHVSLFTLLMTVSTILTMKINTPAQTGGAQMPGMKGMMYMMPVMFMLILNNFSAGLTYYYFLANLITFGQNMISKQFVDEGKILKDLESKKTKPVQKSKWQQRLESAAKQKGYKPSKKK
ncbi:MAG: membrane protein insertase YidC [Bacteroidota bacterium]|nr:membrane protein insertase YidC [Bacteroidota bacterium]